jgi:hypothetical protein
MTTTNLDPEGTPAVTATRVLVLNSGSSSV